jgi:RNA polymerase sigma factor (sigma-70 family)
MASEPANSVTDFQRQADGSPGDQGLADGQLLGRFVTARDEAAFAALVRRHGPMVMGVCRRLLHDAHEAEDAFQATFLVLAHKARSVGRPEALGPWLHGVAYRTAARARQAARRRARELEAAAMPHDGPEVEAAWRELRQVLDEELGRLALKYRAPLVLFYLEGKSTEEVARQLACPKGTVLSRLARGRERLRLRLVRRGVAPSVGLLAGVLAAKAAPEVVPPALALGAVQAAVLTAAGQAASGAIPANVAALTKGVLRSMLLNKLKAAGVVLLAVTAVAVGVGLCARLALADRPTAAGKDEAPKDEEKILGTWALVSFEEGGQKAPEERIKGVEVTFTADGKMISKQGGKEQEFTYKLSPAQTPKEFSGTNAQGRTVLGIYKFDGDTLTVCCDRSGGCPSEFASQGRTVLGIYKFDGDTLTVCCDRSGGCPSEFASKEGTTVVLELPTRF